MRFLVIALCASAVVCGACQSRPPEPAAASSGSGGGAAGGSSDATGSGGAPDPGSERYFIYRRDRWPRWLLVDETHLYWREGVQIFRASKDGTEAPRQFGPLDSTLSTMEMAQDERYVYWVNQDQVRKVDKQTEEVVEFSIGPATGLRSSILVDEQHIYVSQHGCRQLAIVSKEGGALRVVTPSERPYQGGDSSLALDGESVYCAGGSPGAIFRSAKEEEGTTVLVELDEGKSTTGVAVDSSSVYWLTRDTLLSDPEQTLSLSRIQKTGGAVDRLSTHRGNASRALHWDPEGTTLYWVGGGVPNRYDVSTQMYAPLETEPLGALGGLAVDDDYVYWTETDGIVRQPK